MAGVCAAQRDHGSKEASDKCCPVCVDSGRRILTLRQINAEEAIYVCENPACCYPVGYDAKLIRRPILVLLGGEKQANPSGQETDKINDGMSAVFQSLESSASHSVQRPGMCEDAAPWHSTAAMDSLLDPEVANFLDSMQ